MTTSSKALVALAAATGVLLVPAGAAPAASTGLAYRSVPLQSAVTGFDGVVAKGSVRLLLPSSWVPRTTRTALVLRNTRSSACAYTITVRAAYVLGDRGADTGPLVEALTPATGPFLLDAGTRGTTSWRVTRIKQAGSTSTTRIRLKAVRMAPSAITAGRGNPLPAGKQVFLRTTVTATDRTGDECHTGTYRDAVGPQIGDGLVMQRGRGYLTAAG